MLVTVKLLKLTTQTARTVRNMETQQIGKMVEIKLDKPVYQKLVALARRKSCTPEFLLTDIILEKTRQQEFEFFVPKSLYDELARAASAKGQTLEAYVDNLLFALIYGHILGPPIKKGKHEKHPC
jgi:hypothetical protein